MKLVDFIIIGVQKSGTTSLAEWLNCHSQLSLCSQKEPDFFFANRPMERKTT